MTPRLSLSLAALALSAPLTALLAQGGPPGPAAAGAAAVTLKTARTHTSHDEGTWLDVSPDGQQIVLTCWATCTLLPIAGARRRA
jgi:hypothetical protein